MFEILFDLPMDLQFYVIFMSAMLPLSLFVVYNYFDKTRDTYCLAQTGSSYDVYFTKSLRYHTDLPTNTVIIFITNCIKLKDSPNDDKSDHHLLLTP